MLPNLGPWCDGQTKGTLLPSALGVIVRKLEDTGGVGCMEWDCGVCCSGYVLETSFGIGEGRNPPPGWYGRTTKPGTALDTPVDNHG